MPPLSGQEKWVPMRAQDLPQTVKKVPSRSRRHSGLTSKLTAFPPTKATKTSSGTCLYHVTKERSWFKKEIFMEQDNDKRQTEELGKYWELEKKLRKWFMIVCKCKKKKKKNNITMKIVDPF